MSELLKLGIEVAQSTVSKYLRRSKRPPSQGWRTFVRNRLGEMNAIDFAVVPTVRGQLLYLFVVLSLARRRVLNVNVTAPPTARSSLTQPRAATKCPSYGRSFREGLPLFGGE